MPKIEQNLEHNRIAWGKEWLNDGEEWSRDFGDTRTMYKEFITPWIGPWLPAESILEIAVGYGRVSEHLSADCTQLYGIDLNANCVRATKKRLPQSIIMQTDGYSIPFDDEVKFDLVFSWDSLVHCDPEIVKSYIKEAASHLTELGGIVLHHSNWKDSGATLNPHWRNEDSSARDIADYAVSLGFEAVQDTFKWGCDYSTDCVTTLWR